MEEYKNADMVELHAAGVVIHPKRYPDANTGWAEDPEEGWRLAVRGDVLRDLARHFGLETYPVTQVAGNGKTHRADLGDYDITLFRERRLDIGSGDDEDYMATQQIGAIEARCDGPSLLHLRVTLVWRARKDEAEESEVRNLTYSGAYTVWWSAA